MPKIIKNILKTLTADPWLKIENKSVNIWALFDLKTHQFRNVSNFWCFFQNDRNPMLEVMKKLKQREIILRNAADFLIIEKMTKDDNVKLPEH